MIALIKFKSYLNSLLKNSQQHKVLEDSYIPNFGDLNLQVQAIKSLHANQSEESNKEQKYPVLEGLRKYASEQILLSGKPGSGKSTALRELELREAKQCLKMIEQNQDKIPPIPILIKLRDLRGSILAHIKEKLEWHIELDDQVVKKLIRDCQLLILLDGLNELPDSSTLQEVEKFRQLCGEFKTPLIITTRELGSTLIQGDIKKLEMSPLTEQQMSDFVHTKLPDTGEKLLSQLKEKLKELTETPLLLQILCEVFSERGEIPKNRGELFRKELARRYDKFKPQRLMNVSDDSRRFAFELLCYLAFTMIQGTLHVDPCKATDSWITIPKIKAENILAKFLSDESNPKAKAKEWLEDLLEWHLLQVASDQGRLEFHHQLFQEYYAGEYLAEQLDKLSDEELQRNYLNYLKWTEPIEIAMSFVESETLAVRMTKLALNVDLKLGAEIAGSVDFDFQAKTVSMISELQIPDRLKVYLLGETKSSLIVDVLIEMINLQDAETRQVIAWASRKLSPNYAIRIMNRAIEDSEPQVRDTAIKAMGEIDIEQAVSFVIPFLAQESEASVRETAVICILSKSKSQEAIVQLLKSTQDEDHNVSTMATYGLETNDRQRVLFILTKLLKNKNNELHIRENAAEQLGKLGDENVIRVLYETILCADAGSELLAKARMSHLQIFSRLTSFFQN